VSGWLIRWLVLALLVVGLRELVLQLEGWGVRRAIHHRRSGDPLQDDLEYLAWRRHRGRQLTLLLVVVPLAALASLILIGEFG
jgi:hypothetical protein